MANSKRIPLSVPYLKGNEAKYAKECVDSGWVSSAGPWVDRFEREFARYLGVSDAVSMTSGSAALHVALLCSGVEAGDIVLVPTLTFIASVNSIHYAGAHPVFIDCDESLNIDPAATLRFLREECDFRGGVLTHRKSGRRVRAIMPVHIFGHPASLGTILEAAEEFSLRVIEDATESLGSVYSEGKRPTGTIGHIGCFSFNGNKIITTGGGGMLVSRDPAIVAKARYLSTQAKDDPLFYVHDEVGYNYRLTSVQAAIGIAQLEVLPKILETKRKNFAAYGRLLKDAGIAGHLIGEPADTHSNHWLYTLLFDRPIELRTVIEKLQERGIEARPVWKLNHLQKPYREEVAYDISRAEQLYPRLLNIPSSADLEAEDVARVVDALREVLALR